MHLITVDLDAPDALDIEREILLEMVARQEQRRRQRIEHASDAAAAQEGVRDHRQH